MLNTLRPEDLNVHWIPMTQFCTPCQLNFTHVLKTEFIKDEEEHMLNELKWSHLVERQWHNKMRPNQFSEDELTKMYFNQLSYRDILRLYHLYQHDFNLFGYTFEYHHLKFPMGLL